MLGPPTEPELELAARVDYCIGEGNIPGPGWSPEKTDDAGEEPLVLDRRELPTTGDEGPNALCPEPTEYAPRSGTATAS